MLAAEAQNYQIGIGDKLSIQVWQEEDLTGMYPVGKNGTVTLNWVEPISVNGLTVEEAKQKLTTALAQYLRKPIVTVTVVEYRSQQVTVLGEVKNPGQYYLKSDHSLVHLLLREVGGVSSNAADTVSIVRLASDDPHKPPETITVNLAKLLKGDTTQNVALQDGDTVLVQAFANTGIGATAGSDTIWVLGEVNRPGYYKIRDGYTVLSAIMDAGNFTKFASQNSVRVTRGSGANKKEFTVKIKDVIKSGDKAKDMPLLPGDFIYVSKSLL